jgi:hypothetical protein
MLTGLEDPSSDLFFIAAWPTIIRFAVGHSSAARKRKSPASAGLREQKATKSVGTNQMPHRVLLCREACPNWGGTLRGNNQSVTLRACNNHP